MPHPNKAIPPRPATPPGLIVRPFALYATVDLFDRIAASDYPADRLMNTFFKERKQLGKRDRGFIAETVYGMLRHRRWLEWAFPDLDTMHRALAYLAIHQPDATLPLEPADVEQLHRAVRQARERPLPEPPAERLALEYSMPDWMVREWVDRFGEEEAGALCAALNQPAPLIIRTNTLKTTRDALQQRLAEAGHASRPTPSNPDGLILEQKANLFHTPAFHEGWFEVQDEGSQLLSYLLNPTPGAQVVDGCAGGGGKTLHLAALMQNKGILYAFDVAHRRLEEAKPRIRRAGVSNVRLRPIDNNRSRDVTRLHGKIDAVLIDAPCSGSGVLRRNPDATWKITPEVIERLRVEQQALLEAYAPLVRPGGRLVYATCSLFAEENERQVDAFLDAHPAFSRIPAATALSEAGAGVSGQTDDYLRLYPHRQGTDGFFGAVLVRNSQF